MSSVVKNLAFNAPRARRTARGIERTQRHTPISETSTVTHYLYLEARPGSNYRQLFLKGRRIRAAVVYEAVHGPDPYSPEEFAREYTVPLEAVREALDYAASTMALIEAERDREAADVQTRHLDRPTLQTWSSPESPSPTQSMS